MCVHLSLIALAGKPFGTLKVRFQISSQFSYEMIVLIRKSGVKEIGSQIFHYA